MNLLHSIVSPALLAAEGSNGKWLPADINEVIWGSLAFLIVATLLVKFGKAPIVNGLKARSDRIAEHLGEAAAAREAAEAERDRIKAALADSDSEAARIVEDARRAADQLEVDLPELGKAGKWAELVARIDTFLGEFEPDDVLRQKTLYWRGVGLARTGEMAKAKASFEAAVELGAELEYGERSAGMLKRFGGGK